VFCENADLVLDQLVEDHSEDFVAIRYHGWWPSPIDPFYVYNPSENGSRINYYGINGVPHVQLDGIIDAGHIPGTWWPLIQNRGDIEAPLDIALSGQFNESLGEGLLDIAITATDSIEWQDLRIRIALTESEIFFQAPNGTQWHNQVMRDLIPYPYGVPITIEEGEVILHSEIFSCPPPLVQDNCELVVWVQDHGGHEVLQASRISLDDLSPTATGERELALTSDFRLSQNFPNPFNGSTTISFTLPNDGLVSLKIYDILGRELTELVGERKTAGTHNIQIDSGSLSTGIYIYRLKVDGFIVTKRLTVLK
jgi:hypothetical protein